MDKEHLIAFEKVIPKYIPSMEDREKLSPRFIQKIKSEIKQELQYPSVSIYKKDMAKFIIDHQIAEGKIKNREDFESNLPNFVLNNLEQIEIDSIADSYFIRNKQIKVLDNYGSSILIKVLS